MENNRENETEFWLDERLKDLRSQGPVPYTHVFYFLVTMTIINHLLNPYIGYKAVGFVYLMGVIIVGFRSTLGPILLASFGGAFIWNWFFIPPEFTLRIGNTEDIMMCISFIVVGLLSGYLARKTRRKELVLALKEKTTRVLFQLLEDYSRAMSIEELCALTEKTTLDLFSSQIKVLLVDDSGQLKKTTVRAGAVSESEYAQALWTLESQISSGWGTTYFEKSRVRFVPISSQQKKSGVLLFYPGIKKLTDNESDLLQNICSQLSNAIEHLNLQRKNQDLKLLQESEKLHQTLLNSVSHEMRIPLTSIMGIVNVLNDEKIRATPEQIQVLTTELLESGNRLNRVIENLLDMTRLNSGLLTLKKEWIELGDLVRTTIMMLKISDRKIEFNEKNSSVLVQCDEKLVEHALTNLLLNARAYSPAGSSIHIEISLEENHPVIKVIDEGEGIPEDKLQTIFEKFYRLPGSPTGGIGLGLSIVKGIMEAHGGSVRAQNRADTHGAVFTLIFPPGEQPSIKI